MLFRKSLFVLLLLLSVSLIKAEGKGDREKVNSLIKKANLLRNSERNEEAVKYARKALIISRRSGYRDGLIKSFLALGEAYYYLSIEDPSLRSQSIKYFRKYLEFVKQDKNLKEISYTYNVIGILYRREGKYYEALKSYYSSLEFARRIKDSETMYKRISSASYNIAYLFHNIGLYNRALKYYKISLIQEKKLKRKEEIARALGNIALIHRKLGNYKVALKDTKEALKYAKEAGDFYQQTTFLNNIGYIYLTMKEFKKSLIYHRQALRLARGKNFEDMFPYIYSGLGELYYKTHKYKKARIYLLRALENDTHDDPDLERPLYRSLANTFIALNDMKQAKKYFNEYRKYMETRYSPQFFEKIEKLITTLENREKQTEIQLLNSEKRRRELVIKLFLLGSVVLIVLLLWIYFRYRAKQKMNRYLDKISRHDPLTGLSNRRDVLEKLEVEKKRTQRTGRPFVVVLCDIDDFKEVNDTYGHRGGDVVLKGVAEIFKSNLRREDIVGRWGGEEFIIVLCETSLGGAKQAIEKIRAIVEKTPFIYKKHKINITLTFGMCEYRSGFSIETCINLADEALYQGKESGKNRIESISLPS